ncbi:helix-turn-helix domain-containing protein [Stenotrophomonas pigmentata]|uniref:helix-turn-helix domain-containing protein n=1 Tax=Stenotrophomonas pigmentata TaxID=3055080 RepID=UPI0026EEE4B3|nr:helix-turn-helix domain-containing protein [Stenotrophomonas sp. 610A2]
MDATILAAHGMQYGCLDIDGFNPDALLGVVKDTSFEQRLLGAGYFKARAQRLVFPAFSLDRGTYTQQVLAKGMFAPDMMGLALATRCGEPMWLNGRRVEEGQLMIFAEDRELAVRSVSPLWQWAVLRIPRSSLQAAIFCRLRRELALPQHGWRLCPRTADRNLKLRMRVQLALHRASQWGPSTPVAEADMLGELLLDAFVTALERASGAGEAVVTMDRLQQKERFLQRAEAYLRSHEAQQFSSRSLESALSMSERQMERVFRDIYGMTPKRWYQVARLNQARKLLLDEPGSRVTEIAFRSGFSHLGRFASDYRDLFGERPSETHTACNKTKKSH